LTLLLAVTPSWNDRAQAKPGDAFMEAVTARFFVWDTDHNQTLSMEELDAAIKDPGNTGQAAAALAAVKRASLSTNYTLPPLTLNNLRDLAVRPPSAHRPNLARLYWECLKRISDVASREVFASGLPRLETIRQGHIDDCFCLAPLAAMVHRDPQEVASMFSVRDEGHFAVQIGAESVVVAPPTDAERAMGMIADNSQDGLWVNLYEEAIGRLRTDLESPEQPFDLAFEAFAGGGSATRIISYLTGHKVSGFSLKFGKDAATPAVLRESRLAALRQKLAAATGQRRLVTCSTLQPTTPGLAPRHVYALLEYDPTDDTINLWNPHGNHFVPKGPPGPENGYPTTNGLFTIPLREFVQQFTGMAFEGTELAARK
jgi:hypothetical protein